MTKMGHAPTDPTDLHLSYDRVSARVSGEAWRDMIKKGERMGNRIKG